MTMEGGRMGNSERSILVVDDDAGILAACAESLMLDGYRVDIAESGEKALEMVPKRRYNLVVTDLMMHEVDGLGVLDFVKKNSPQTEVIVLTAYGKVDTAVEAMKRGAYDYLTKPFDPHKLDVSVKRAFEHQGLLHELSGLQEILRLYDATKTLSAIRDPQEMLQALAKYALEITDSSGVAILTVSGDEKTLKVAATAGARHGILLGQSMPLDKDRLGALNLDALPTMSSGEVRRQFHFPGVPGFSEITSSLTVPVFFKDRLLAVMNLTRVGDKPAFGNEELRLITIFTAQAGYALENSRLFETIKTQQNQDVYKWLMGACEKVLSMPAAKELPREEKLKLEGLLDQCRRVTS
jgi:DNA-binding response OmpR family regulator